MRSDEVVLVVGTPLLAAGSAVREALRGRHEKTCIVVYVEGTQTIPDPQKDFLLTAQTGYPDPTDDHVRGYRCQMHGCRFDAQDGAKFCRKHLWAGRGR